MFNMYLDGTYLSQNSSWHEKDSPWKAMQISSLMERNSIVSSSICEIGCGAGGVLASLATKEGNESKRFIGFEISPHAFSKCDSKSMPNVEYHLEDVLENGVAERHGAPFDIAMVIDVFEHVEDYLGFLRKIKPIGNYKIFHIPLDLSVQSVLRAWPIESLRRTVGHIHSFTKEIALDALQDAGYEILDHFYTPSALELSNKGWRAGVVRLPRRIAFFLNKDLAVRVLGGYSLLVLAK